MRHEIVAPTDCTIVEIRPEPGDSVPSGATIAIVEMMKIERLVEAPAEGVITEVRVSAGEVVKAGQVLAILEEQSIATTPPPTIPTMALQASGPTLRSTTPAGRCSMMRPGRRRSRRSTLAGVEPPVRTWRILSTRAAFRSTAVSCTPPRRAVEMSTT